MDKLLDKSDEESSRPGGAAEAATQHEWLSADEDEATSIAADWS